MAGNWPPYFSYEVDKMLACPCCGRREMNDEFMWKLVAVRQAVNIPFHVNSGYRCPEYNNKISSTGFRGPHTTGRAVDIAAPSSSMRLDIQDAAKLQGMQRFGIGRTFIHLDDLLLKDGFPRGVWSY